VTVRSLIALLADLKVGLYQLNGGFDQLKGGLYRLEFLLQQKPPIVVNVEPQPAPTPPISYGGMLLSALGLVGLIVVTAFIVGGVIGAVIIWRKKRQEALEPPLDQTHQLRG